MASRFSIGHGMRRRSGIAPTNPLEAVGNMKNRSHMTHHEVVEAAASVGSARLPLSATPAPALQGTLVPKKNTQAMDPTAGGKANRENIERIGAAYHISVPFTPTIDPSAGPTMANARIIPSVAGRTPNFGSGLEAATE